MNPKFFDNLQKRSAEERDRYLSQSIRRFLKRGRPEEAHRQLWEEVTDTPGDPVNAWYHAWELYWRADPLLYQESEGFTEEYLGDVRMAWDAAEAAWNGTRNIDERSQIVGLVARYALITASVRGVSLAAEPGMVSLLLAARMWSPIQTVNFIRQVTDVQQRLDLLDAIGLDLKGYGRYEDLVLESLQGITQPEAQANNLRNLSQHLSTSDARIKAVEIAINMPRSFTSTDWAAYVLEGIPHCLGEYLKNENAALALIHQWHGPDYYRALRAIIPHLPVWLAKDLFDQDSLIEMSLEVEEVQALYARLLIQVATGGHTQSRAGDDGLKDSNDNPSNGDPEWALRRMTLKCYTVAQAAALSGILSNAELSEQQQQGASAQLSNAMRYLVRGAWLDVRHEDPDFAGMYPLSDTPIEGAHAVVKFVQPPGGPCASNVDMLSLYLPNLPEIAFSQAVNWLFEQWNETDDPWIWRPLANALSGEQHHRLYSLLLAQFENRMNAGIIRLPGQQRFLTEITSDIPEDLGDHALRLAEHLLRFVLDETSYLFPDEILSYVNNIIAEIIGPLAHRFGERLIPPILTIIRQIDDDLTRLSGLAALALYLPDSVYEQTLALLRELKRIPEAEAEEEAEAEPEAGSTTLSVLAVAAAQLARRATDESIRSELCEWAQKHAIAVPDSEKKTTTLLQLGGLLKVVLPEDKLRDLTSKALRAHGQPTDHLRIVLTLAQYFPWLNAPTQVAVRPSLHSAVDEEYPARRRDSLFGASVQQERNSILRKIKSTSMVRGPSTESGDRSEIDDLFYRWAGQMHEYAGGSRTRLLAALPEMLLDIKRLGGQPAVEEVYLAIGKVGQWWPQQAEDSSGTNPTAAAQDPPIGTRVLDNKERLVGFVSNSGEIYNAHGQKVGRIFQETILTPRSATPYEVKVQVLNIQDEPVAYLADPHGGTDSLCDMSERSLGTTRLEGTAFLPNDITVFVSATGRRLGHVEGDMPWHAIGGSVLLHRLLS